MWQNGQWTAAAKGSDAQRVGNAMMKTGIGAELWSQMDQSSAPFTFTISQDVEYNNGNVVFGVANTKGTETAHKVKITIYEGSLKLLDGGNTQTTEKHKGMDSQTMNERIGSVGVHESRHGLDPQHDTKREARAEAAQIKYNKQVENSKPIITDPDKYKLK